MDSYLIQQLVNPGGGEAAHLSLSNWVKVDVPLSESHANCSGHNKQAVQRLVQSVLLSYWSAGN